MLTRRRKAIERHRDLIVGATINSAYAFPVFGDLGTLRVGSSADIAILEQRTGEFDFVDNANTSRKGKTKLSTHASLFAGKLVKRSVPLTSLPASLGRASRA